MLCCVQLCFLFWLDDDGKFHVVDFVSGSCGRVDYHGDVKKHMQTLSKQSKQ